MEDESDSKERIYDSLAQVLKEVYFFEEAIHFFLESVKIKLSKSDFLGLAISYGGLGEIYSKMEDFEKAETYIKEDIQISEKFENRYGSIIGIYLLAMMHNKNLEFLIFKKKLEKSDAKVKEVFASQNKTLTLLFEKIENLEINLYDIKVLSLLEKAKFFILENESEKAHDCLDSAKKEIQDSNIKCIGSYYQISALYFESIGDMKNTFQQIELCEDIFRKNNNLLELSACLDLKSNILTRNNRIQEAESALKDAIEICEDLNLEHLVDYFEKRIKETNEKEWLMVRLQRYIGREVAQNLLTDRNEKDTEKINIAILFSDIRSFTTISEKVEPEVLIDMLNTYFGAMTRIVLKHKGAVNKYIGDAIMAYFGYHTDDPNFLRLSLDASLAMLDELQLLNHRFFTLGRPRFNIGIGLHYGEVIAGRIGPISRKEFTIIGDNVNLGSRLEGISKKYGVSLIVSGNFMSAVQASLESNYILIELDIITVKGKETPVSIFTVFRKENLSNRIHAAWQLFSEAREFYLKKQWVDSINTLNLIVEEDLQIIKDFYLKRNEVTH